MNRSLNPDLAEAKEQQIPKGIDNVNGKPKVSPPTLESLGLEVDSDEKKKASSGSAYDDSSGSSSMSSGSDDGAVTISKQDIIKKGKRPVRHLKASKRKVNALPPKVNKHTALTMPQHPGLVVRESNGHIEAGMKGGQVNNNKKRKQQTSSSSSSSSSHGDASRKDKEIEEERSKKSRRVGDAKRSLPLGVHLDYNDRTNYRVTLLFLAYSF